MLLTPIRAARSRRCALHSLAFAGTSLCSVAASAHVTLELARVDAERTRLAVPNTSHGGTATEDMSTVRFSGGVPPDGVYDEFVVAARLPEQAGELYWKVAQICERGRIDWAEVPVEGPSLHDLKFPAARLEVVPAAHGEHAH